MLGRGGQDGSQAAFVILLWVGQAGSVTILSLSYFILFLFDQEAVVQARLWAECCWSKMWTDRPARGRP